MIDDRNLWEFIIGGFLISLTDRFGQNDETKKGESDLLAFPDFGFEFD